MAVTHHRIAAGVSLQAGAAFQHRTDEGDSVSVADDTGLVVGADTHPDTHTAAICDARGRAGSQLQVPSTAEG
jgi:hypothetical protein